MLDLSKIVYKKLEDGQYVIIPKMWELKTTVKGEDYIALTCQLKGTERTLSINLFEKGLSITAGNVSEFLGLPELTLADTLDAMLNKELPAYHQTVTIEGKTYYNWYICSTPTLATDEDGPAF